MHQPNTNNGVHHGKRQENAFSQIILVAQRSKVANTSICAGHMFPNVWSEIFLHRR